ncbi:MAG TPA: BrnA antitoxin family protein [Bauldia sp.]|nr:BrnA antitoxin family protein [Bauldia sp.]
MTGKYAAMRTVRKPAHIRQADWDSVDFPPLTDEQLARMRPAREVFPDIDKFPKPRGRGPQKSPTKTQVTIRIDRDTLDHFRKSGRGWQTRVNEALGRIAKSEKKRAAKR